MPSESWRVLTKSFLWTALGRPRRSIPKGESFPLCSFSGAEDKDRDTPGSHYRSRVRRKNTGTPDGRLPST